MRVIEGLLLSAAVLAPVGVAHAASRVEMLPSRGGHDLAPSAVLQSEVARAFDLGAYRAVRAQVIYGDAGVPDHVVVYLHSQQFHRVDLARMDVDRSLHATRIEHDYVLTPADHAQQPGLTAPACPDESIEFVAFAPNNIALEQSVTVEVANAAIAKGLKTKQLLLADATRQNYMDYMSCPKLKGNFYDGDANPQVITTADGEMMYTDFTGPLKGAFRLEVTNIWLACEAYNDPMLSAVQSSAQAKKYAAGINDLEVGPSDQAGACAMEAALDGQPMTAAFQACYQKDDVSADQWGFGGQGTDDFWK